MRRPQLLLAASLWLVVAWAASANAQSAAPAAAAAPASVAPAPLTPIAEIGPQAEQVAEQLRRMAEAISDEAPIAALEANVGDVSRRAAQRWDDTGRLLDGAPRRTELDSLEGVWNALRVDFDRLGDNLDARVRRRESDLATLVALAESWSASRKLAQQTDAPAALLERVDATLSAIAATRGAVEQRRDRVLVLQDTVSRALQASDDSLDRIEDARQNALRRAFSSRERPVWQTLREGRLRDAAEAERLAQQVGEWLAPLLSYVVAAHGESFAFTLLLWPLLAWLLRWIGVPSPIASALLFTLALTIPLRPEAPVILRQVVLVIVLSATLALLRPIARPRAFASACVLSGLLVVDLLRTLLWVWPGLEQIILLVEFTAAAGVFLWAGRNLPAPWRSETAGLWVTRVFAGACALAVGFAGFGLLELADFVGSGVIILACFGVGVHALRAALEQVLALARGRLPAGGLPRMEQDTQRLLDVAAIGLWLFVALDRYELLRPTTDALSSVLSARLEIGGLSLSFGGALGFVATVLGGWLLSRVVVFVLEAAVFPRASLPRGVPYALTSLARYGVLLGGFLFALVTLGLDLTHLTLLVSALGLGLGFGLQQIVQNFVSGLILLFERPVQIGDGIQLAELTGVVERIGIRSSTLRTFDGAEVIVPNSNLVEQRVTNWTLSDRRRRIDLSLTVGQDRDPARALALLLEVAKSDPRIANAPAPEALLLRFAEANLELQLLVWTDEPNWMRVKSDLAVALHAALRADGARG
jgi:small-conductance mechanosensitive channel